MAASGIMGFNNSRPPAQGPQVLCFVDSAWKVLHAIEVAVVQLAQVKLVGV